MNCPSSAEILEIVIEAEQAASPQEAVRDFVLALNLAYAPASFTLVDEVASSPAVIPISSPCGFYGSIRIERPLESAQAQTVETVRNAARLLAILLERKKDEPDASAISGRINEVVQERAREMRDEQVRINAELSEHLRTETELRQRVSILTRPPEDTSGLRFEDLFSVEQIQEIQDAFAQATGVASIITDPSGRPITRPSNFSHLCEHVIRRTPAGLANCMKSDAVIGFPCKEGPTVQPCLSAGLMDAGASICVADRHLANWLIGQVLDESVDPEQVVKYADTIGANHAEFRDALKRVTRMSRKQFEMVARALFLISNQMSLLALQNVQQAREITRRRRVEEELRNSERRFKEMLETVHLLAIMLDLEGRVTFCNDYLANLLGYSKDELLGQDWFDLTIPEQDREKTREVFNAAVHGRLLVDHYENPILTRTGEAREIVWDNTILRDIEGKVIGTASLGRDVTDHVRLEQQYRQAQKMEAVGQLAGGIAHDFNNLLQVITGYLELAMSTMTPGQTPHPELETALGAANRATGLTRQLLTFSRRNQVRFVNVSLDDIIANMSKMLRRIIGEQIEFCTILHANLPLVHADPNHIEQVLVNLCVNARDAMPKGGQLTIETSPVHVHPHSDEHTPTLSPGDYVCISVSDTGSGMTPAVMSHAFEPFFTTKEVGRGTGLGLSTVYGIVRQHNGTIDVQSWVGQGSIFRIYLPAFSFQVEDEAMPPGQQDELTPASGVILLAEDDEQVRSFAVRVLQEAGYEVIIARDGEEAIASFRAAADRINLVVADVVMPKLDGRAVYEAISANRPDMPVLFCSGYSFGSLTPEDFPRGNVDIIEKPFRPRDLLRKIDALRKKH